MIFIGICGASGSGKSTLAQELAKMVGKSILIINQDAYYYDHPDMTFEESIETTKIHSIFSFGYV